MARREKKLVYSHRSPRRKSDEESTDAFRALARYIITGKTRKEQEESENGSRT